MVIDDTEEDASIWTVDWLTLIKTTEKVINSLQYIFLAKYSFHFQISVSNSLGRVALQESNWFSRGPLFKLQ